MQKQIEGKEDDGLHHQREEISSQVVPSKYVDLVLFPY